MAVIAADVGRFSDAAMLIGAFDALTARYAVRPPVMFELVVSRDDTSQLVRSKLDADTYARAYEAGAALGLDAAVEPPWPWPTISSDRCRRIDPARVTRQPERAARRGVAGRMATHRQEVELYRRVEALDAGEPVIGRSRASTASSAAGSATSSVRRERADPVGDLLRVRP